MHLSYLNKEVIAKGNLKCIYLELVCGVMVTSKMQKKKLKKECKINEFLTNVPLYQMHCQKNNIYHLMMKH